MNIQVELLTMTAKRFQYIVIPVKYFLVWVCVYFLFTQPRISSHKLWGVQCGCNHWKVVEGGDILMVGKLMGEERGGEEWEKEFVNILKILQ